MKHQIGSMTIAGLMLLILVTIKSKVGINITETELEKTVEVILWITGAIVTYIGRVRHGDLWIVKKPSSGEL